MNSMYDKGIPKCIEKGGEKERKKSSSVSTILWTILFWGETQQKLQKICICTMERDHKKEIEFLRIYDFRFRSSFSFHFCPAKSSRFSPKQKEKKSKGWKTASKLQNQRKNTLKIFNNLMEDTKTLVGSF